MPISIRPSTILKAHVPGSMGLKGLPIKTGRTKNRPIEKTKGHCHTEINKYIGKFIAEFIL